MIASVLSSDVHVENNSTYDIIYNFYFTSFNSFNLMKLKQIAENIPKLKCQPLSRLPKLEFKKLICKELTNAHLQKSNSMLEIILMYELIHIIPQIHPHR
jgi:hypothetical protein